MRYNYSISCLAFAAAMSLGPVAAFAQTTQGATSNQMNTNQAQKQSTANTEAGACDRLIDRLRAMQIDQRPIRLRQARQYRQNNNTEACQQSLQQVDQRAQSGNRSGEAAGGQITVQRAAPSVTVSRGQPEITIQQQRPIVTVEIPPPRVTVRMPEPDVNVVTNQQEPNVQYSEQNTKPKVNYETAEPQVNVRQSKQSPEVNIERTGQSGGRESVQSSGSNQAAASQSSSSQARISVDDLTDMSLYTERGELIGDVERVVRNSNGATRVIVGHGGILGMGEKQIAVDIDKVFKSGDYLYAKGLSQTAASGMPEWNEQAGVTDLDDDQTLNIEMRARRDQSSMGYNPSQQN
ncbi:MAG: PRC-barrel domain-containing protein [Hyphomicrobium sp.]|nr:PRC-barrel domain-containing protein [Hyphomicrobium sp.]